jgi:hypothetical protein
MWLEGATIDTVMVFLSKASPSELERTKKGVAQIRLGAFQSLGGVIATLPTNGIADDWRRQRLALFAVIAPKAAKFLLPEDLRQLSDAANAAAASDDGSERQVCAHVDCQYSDAAMSGPAALIMRGTYSAVRDVLHYILHLATPGYTAATMPK